MFQNVAARWHNFDERYRDWRLGITTRFFIEPKELGYTNGDFRGCSPTTYRDFRAILLCLQPPAGTFIDYGAGAGRVVILAKRAGFERSIGIEFSHNMVLIGRENLKNNGLISRHASILESNATDFRPPPEASTFFFANSFTGPTLQKVVENIHESYMERPRPISLVGNLISGKSQFSHEIETVPWLRTTRDFALPTGRRCLILTPK